MPITHKLVDPQTGEWEYAWFDGHTFTNQETWEHGGRCYTKGDIERMELVAVPLTSEFWDLKEYAQKFAILICLGRIVGGFGGWSVRL